MIGAICGDILGSTYEFGAKDKEIYLIHEDDSFTDDTVLTCAVAKWALEYADLPILGDSEHQYILAQYFYDFTMKYPDKAYGTMYSEWVLQYRDSGLIPAPNNSWGNGAAMRVSPIAYAFDSLDKVEHYAKIQSEVTHDNKKAIDAACAIAAGTKLALDGKTKSEILSYVENKYAYQVFDSIEKAKSTNFNCNADETVTQALTAFALAEDYEETIMNAILIDGDVDTVAAMAGSIAYAYYKVIPDKLLKHCESVLDAKLLRLYKKFKEKYMN